MVVTDLWLQMFGFSAPTKSNIDKIVEATKAQANGYVINQRVDLDREARLFGDPFKGEGSAVGIEPGEGIGRWK